MSIDLSNNYHSKYLKYKKKYLDLKNQVGYGKQINITVHIEKSDKIYISMESGKINFDTFKKAVMDKFLEEKKKNLIRSNRNIKSWDDFKMIEFNNGKDMLDIKNEKEINELLKKIKRDSFIDLRTLWLVKKLSEKYIDCNNLPENGDKKYWNKCQKLIKCSDLNDIDKKTHTGIEKRCKKK
jgi:peroxiredoxin family protein